MADGRGGEFFVVKVARDGAHYPRVASRKFKVSLNFSRHGYAPARSYGILTRSLDVISSKVLSNNEIVSFSKLAFSAGFKYALILVVRCCS